MLGDAEIGNYRLSGHAHQDVGGLEVAVDDARGMNGRQRRGYLGRAFLRLLRRHARFDVEPQIAPRQILHADEQATVADTVLMDARDMRMGKLREHVVFGHEAVDGLLRRGIDSHQLENLQGMLLAAGDVCRQVDQGSGALTEFLDDLVALDARQILQCILAAGMRIGDAGLACLNTAVDGIGDFLRLEWFDEKIGRAHMHRATIMSALVETGNKNDIGLADSCVASQGARKTEPIHAGHANVGNDNGRWPCPQLLQGILATARHRGVMAARSQTARDVLTHHRIVFDHQNLCHARMLRDDPKNKSRGFPGFCF